MDIIPVSQDEYDTYVELLLRRDSCKKHARNAEILYIREFGELMTTSFQKQVECIAKKKSIAYYQAAANRGEKVKMEELDAWLHREMEEYERRLSGMLKEYQSCRNAETVSMFDTEKVKKIYHKIAKQIHPDMHPDLERTDELNELWLRVKAAYQGNDLASMQELEVLVNRYLEEQGIEDAEPDLRIPDIQEKIDTLRAEIERITTTEPYTYETLLNDEDAVAAKKKELQEEIDTYTAYAEELDKTLAEFLKEGVIIKWPMN